MNKLRAAEPEACSPSEVSVPAGFLASSLSSLLPSDFSCDDSLSPSRLEAKLQRPSSVLHGCRPGRVSPGQHQDDSGGPGPVEDLPRDRNRDDHHQAGQVRRPRLTISTLHLKQLNRVIDPSDSEVFCHFECLNLNNRMCDLLHETEKAI